MIVYKVTNQANNKIYVGQTTHDLRHRKGTHIKGVNKNDNNYFHNALRKHGIDSFKWEVIRICNNINELNAFEQYYILYYDSVNTGYNLMSGGSNGRHSAESIKKMSGKNNPMYGKKHSKKTIEKMRQIKLGKNNVRYGKHHTKEAKQRMRENSVGFLGRHHTIESKERISIATSGERNPMYGKNHLNETKEKISTTRIERKVAKGKNNPFYGKHHTAETKEKLRQQHLSMTISEETRIKISKANSGKKHTKETKKKIGDAQRGEKGNMFGKHPSEETKQRMRESRFKYLANQKTGE